MGSERAATKLAKFYLGALAPAPPAPRDAACELAEEASIARIAFNVTLEQKRARCFPRAGGKARFEDVFDFGPGSPRGTTVSPTPEVSRSCVTRRDPSDIRANTARGLLFLERGFYREVEERLETAATKAEFAKAFSSDPGHHEAGRFLGK
jgi:hypothetical protein